VPSKLQLLAAKRLQLVEVLAHGDDAALNTPAGTHPRIAKLINGEALAPYKSLASLALRTSR
jgi:hypothetical protein